MTDETRGNPVEVDADGLKVVMAPETEAHWRRAWNVSETEAHGFSVSPADPALDAHARLRLSFPPDAPEQTLELRYRPSSTPGEPPEVEVHTRRFY